MAARSDARRGIYIGLGANLGEPMAQIEHALATLDASADVAVMRASSAYRTPPWGNTAQPAFVNAVAEIASSLEPPAIVARLLAIERAAGRDRGDDVARWSPRRLDLDLLLDGDAVLDAPECTVPHPRLAARGFVLVPLAELDGAIPIPGLGTAAACLARLPEDERAAAVRIGPLEWRRGLRE